MSPTPASVDEPNGPRPGHWAGGIVGHATTHHLLARGERVIGIDIFNEHYDPSLKAARLATFKGQANFRFEKMDIADAGRSPN